MKPHQLAHASFTIYQDIEPPEFWTAYFGVAPSRAGMKGHPRIMPSGRVSEFPWRQGIWSVSSKQDVTSNSLTPHFHHLVRLLGLPRPDLRELIERTHAHACFFCYWNNYEENRTPDVPEDIRQMCEAMGVAIEIDEYK